jgi:hypothetical protein
MTSIGPVKRIALRGICLYTHQVTWQHVRPDGIGRGHGQPAAKPCYNLPIWTACYVTRRHAHCLFPTAWPRISKALSGS